MAWSATWSYARKTSVTGAQKEGSSCAARQCLHFERYGKSHWPVADDKRQTTKCSEKFVFYNHALVLQAYWKPVTQSRHDEGVQIV